MGKTYPVLTRDTLATMEATKDLPQEVVQVPEWGCAVVLRGLSAGAQVEYTNNNITYNEDGSLKTSAADNAFNLIALCMIDADGHLLYPDAAEGAKALRAKSGPALVRLMRAASRLSGIGLEDMDEAKNDSAPAQGSD